MELNAAPAPITPPLLGFTRFTCSECGAWADIIDTDWERWTATLDDDGTITFQWDGEVVHEHAGTPPGE